MERYHVNAKGEVHPCEAAVGFCPLGGMDGHDSEPTVVRKLYERFMENLENPQESVKFHFVSTQETNAFTRGDCAHLSKAIESKYGFPIFYLGDGDSRDGKPSERRWSHFVNRLADGRFMDAEGIWTEKELLKRWQRDDVGSGWLPSSVNPCERGELRAMGVTSPDFPHVKPASFLKKLHSHLGHILSS